MALVHEVKNACGDRIAFAVPAGLAAGGARPRVRATAVPGPSFIAADQTCGFERRVPGTRRAPGGALAPAAACRPLMPPKAAAAIHRQAPRLQLKHAPRGGGAGRRAGGQGAR